MAIVDIDGVVADVRHRLHHLQRRPKDWRAFFAAARDDPPHPEGLAAVNLLGDEHDIVFVTGRPERLRAVTTEWLTEHGIAAPIVIMRDDDDRRPAAQVKVELLAELSQHRRIAVVVDDDPVVLAAVQAAGYPTFAADWERRSAGDDAAILDAQERAGET